MQRVLATCIFLILLLRSQWLPAQSDWTRFRGPNGTGQIADADLPTTWDTPVWSVDLAGVGSSCPVAWGKQIFVASCDMQTAEVRLQCLDQADGQQVWIKHFPSEPYHLHGRNTYAASTAAVDEHHVYTCFANPDQTVLVALDHDGSEVWRRDFGRWVSSHGFGTSPIVHGNLVVFCNSQSAEELPPGVPPGSSRLIAVNRMTGEDVWSLGLTTKRVCYSVPCLWKDADGKEQLVNCNTADGFYCVDPQTGIRKWSVLPFKMRVVASPLLADGLLLGSCGSGGGGNYLVAMNPSEVAADQDPKPAFQVRQSNYVPCPIAVGGLLFIFSDKGIAQCVDLKTGKRHWKKRLSSGFSASPVANETYIYAVDEEGVVFVIKADAEFQQISKISLGEATRATPMIANDQLIFRTRSKLICID